jgi:hypothetical protein
MRIVKALFAVLSWGPSVWTVLILVAAYCCYRSPLCYDIFYPMKGPFILLLVFYMFIGSITWALLLLVLLLKRQNSRWLLFHVCLAAAGVFAGWYSLAHDVFNVSGGYID